MTASDVPSLAELRREIDAIDVALHDLIMRRTEIVQEIGQHKAADRSAMRPAREAEILRALAARHHGSFPLASVVRIWRELISTLTRMQGPFAVAVHAPGDTARFWDMARDHFGSTTPMTAVNSPIAAFRAVVDGSCAVGMMPLPKEDDPDPWWRYLFSDDPKVPRIIARLPFLTPAGARFDEAEAFAIAAVPMEPTGSDQTLIGIEMSEDFSRGRLRDLLEQVSLSPLLMRTHSLQGGGAVHLILVDSFVAATDSRLEAAASRLAEALVRILPVGSYATPISAAALDDARKG